MPMLLPLLCACVEAMKYHIDGRFQHEGWLVGVFSIFVRQDHHMEAPHPPGAAASGWLMYRRGGSCPQSTKESLDPSCLTRNGPLHRSLNNAHKLITSKVKKVKVACHLVRRSGPHGALDPERSSGESFFVSKKKKKNKASTSSRNPRFLVACSRLLTGGVVVCLETLGEEVRSSS